MSPLQLYGLLVLLGSSAYLAASEVALFSLSKFQLREFKHHFKPTYRRIKRLLADSSGLLITLLVLNEILNISISSIMTQLLTLGSTGEMSWVKETLVDVAITTPLVLFFCEVTPKVIAVRANQLIAGLTAGPLSIIYDLCKPLRILLGIFLGSITRTRSAVRKGDSGTKLKEADFLLMLEEAHRLGTIRKNEIHLIQNVFELDDLSVTDVATPLSQVLSLPAHTSIKGALQVLRSQRFSRIPITDPGAREVVGILYAKDLIQSCLKHDLATAPVSSLMRRPLFVSPTVRLTSLFRRFKQMKIHMAIIKNSSGEISGVVTMNDILETLLEKEDAIP